MGMAESRLQLKRVYEPPAPSDGMRVLVDRLWPRGVRKENAQIDVWLKDVAPSPNLRKWFDHDPERFDAFRVAYERELSLDKAAYVEQMLDLMRRGKVTLVYAARDLNHNHVVVLRDFLLDIHNQAP